MLRGNEGCNIYRVSLKCLDDNDTLRRCEQGYAKNDIFHQMMIAFTIGWKRLDYDVESHGTWDGTRLFAAAREGDHSYCSFSAGDFERSQKDAMHNDGENWVK